MLYQGRLSRVGLEVCLNQLRWFYSFRELVLRCTGLREVVRIGVYVQIFHQVVGYQNVLFFPYVSFGRICNLHLESN